MTRRQRTVVTLCVVLAITDGLDAQLLAYAAPHIAKELGFGPTSFGVVFSASLVGMALGSITLGMLADRFGRSRVLISGTTLFSLATLALPWLATDIPSFIAMRFVAGLGLGGVTPVLIAIIAENTPRQVRSLAVMVAVGSLSLGAFASGLVSSWLIPVQGWRSTFVFGGTVPILIAAALFLALRGLARTAGAPASAAYAQGDVRTLFRDGRLLSTLTLWAVFFANLLVLFALLNWLPSLFVNLGLSTGVATTGGAVFSLGGFVGGLLMGLLLGRTGRAHAVVATGFGVGILGIAVVATGPSSLAVLLVGVALAGAGVVGGLTGISALAVLLYPDQVRAAGLGWAYGVGRVGSIIGPVVSGVMVGAGLGATSIIGLAAVPAAVAGAGVIALGTLHRRRRPHAVTLPGAVAAEPAPS
jgi:AAHS family 4-hydroxybenzoate transporter-like MFS transporter